MRKYLLVICLLLWAGVAHAQDSTQQRVIGVNSTPATCRANSLYKLIVAPWTLWKGGAASSCVVVGAGDTVGAASSTDNAVARLDGTTGKVIQNSAVTIDDSGSINIPTGQTYKINNVALAKGDVGLGNVDNTSDASKPVSTAQQTALDLKQNLLTNSAGLRAALSDESGTGVAFFQGGNIGAASATSLTTSGNINLGGSASTNVLLKPTTDVSGLATLRVRAGDDSGDRWIIGAGLIGAGNLSGGISASGIGWQNGSASYYGTLLYDSTRNMFRFAQSGAANGIVIGETTYNWYSGASGSTALDTGLARALAGVVKTTNGSTGGGAMMVGDVVGSRPTCSVTIRGAMWVTNATAGNGDILQVCMKGTADTYAWRDAFTAP